MMNIDELLCFNDITRKLGGLQELCVKVEELSASTILEVFFVR